MEKLSIGSFIAALRKSKGMTQQEVAEKLNVSNKTISKWECGDGYPEIMIIPAIAELFEVTTDEILKGKRIISNNDEIQSKSSDNKKQMNFLLNKMNVRFKNLSYLATALLLLGFICLFCISYAFYKPILGFGIMMVFVIAGVIIEFIAINNIHSSYETSDMLTEKNDISMKYLKVLYSYTAFVFSTGVFVIISSLPFILIRSNHYKDNVISLVRYIPMLPFLFIAAAIICFIGRHIGRRKIERTYFDLIPSEDKKNITSLKKKITIITITVFLVTILINILALGNMPRSVEKQYANKKDFEMFISSKEQYEKEKDAAVKRKARLVNGILDKRQVVVEQVITNEATEKESFYLVSEFENVEEIDYENFTITTRLNNETIVSNEISLKRLFVSLYLVEIYFFTILYIILRRKISII